MLDWYFFHSSYSGPDSVSNDLIEIYTRSLSKPGFLRGMLNYFAAAFDDAVYFPSKVNSTGKLQMPVLAMGGECSNRVVVASNMNRMLILLPGRTQEKPASHQFTTSELHGNPLLPICNSQSCPKLDIGWWVIIDTSTRSF